MIKKLLFFATAIIIYMVLFCTAFALETENEISFAEVIVKPKHDATLDIEYTITLNVSENATEPVSFVLMRIPNNKVDKIKAKSSNIRNVRYSFVNYGEFIRVDFKKAYTRGETAEFAFSLHQSYIYSLEDDKCLYNFIPCEFKDMEIKSERVYWQANNIIESNSSIKDNKYQLWAKDAEDSGIVKTVVTYNQNNFKFSKEGSKEYATDRGYSVEHLVLVLLGLVGVVAIVGSFTSERHNIKNNVRGYTGYNY